MNKLYKLISDDLLRWFGNTKMFGEIVLRKQYEEIMIHIVDKLNQELRESNNIDSIIRLIKESLSYDLNPKVKRNIISKYVYKKTNHINLDKYPYIIGILTDDSISEYDIKMYIEYRRRCP